MFAAFNAAKDTFNELYYLIHDGLSPEIDSITDEIPLDKRVVDQCFILGTAARIAANYGDTLREEYLAKSYNRRRKRCVRRMVYTDVLPTVEEG